MPKCVAKTISPSDAGERKTHRAAIRLPEQEALRLFPKPLGRDRPHEFNCEDHTGKRWPFKYTSYKSGPRIRPIEGYLRNYSIQPGDTITICAPESKDGPCRIYYATKGDGFRLPGKEDPADMLKGRACQSRSTVMRETQGTEKRRFASTE